MTFNFGSMLTIIEGAFSLLPQAKVMVQQVETLIPAGQGGGTTKMAMVEQGITALITAEQTLAPLVKEIWAILSPLLNIYVAFFKGSTAPTTPAS